MAGATLRLERRQRPGSSVEQRYGCLGCGNHAFFPSHRPDAPLVLLTPTYMPFVVAASRFGRDTIQVGMLQTESGWTIDWPGLERALDGGGLLVLVNPHNPIGKVYAREELERISLLVESTGSRVFSDEIHAPLVYRGSVHVPYASSGRLPRAIQSLRLRQRRLSTYPD